MTGRVLALVPAHNQAGAVGETVAALRALPEVLEVLVVDDGSADATTEEALAAGAHCLTLARRRGRGGALNAGLTALTGRVADGITPAPDVLLLAEAGLGRDAAHLSALLGPILDGSADLVIASSPAKPARRAPGPPGTTETPASPESSTSAESSPTPRSARVVRPSEPSVVDSLARWGARRLTGRQVREPLAAERAIRWDRLGAVLPFAPGQGAEAAMTVAALDAALRVVEVPVALAEPAPDRRGWSAVARDLPAVRDTARRAGAVGKELVRHAARRRRRRSNPS
jgi:Glycosyl transferase family 2